MGRFLRRRLFWLLATGALALDVLFLLVGNLGGAPAPASQSALFVWSLLVAPYMWVWAGWATCGRRTRYVLCASAALVWLAPLVIIWPPINATVSHLAKFFNGQCDGFDPHCFERGGLFLSIPDPLLVVAAWIGVVAYVVLAWTTWPRSPDAAPTWPDIWSHIVRGLNRRRRPLWGLARWTAVIVPIVLLWQTGITPGAFRAGFRLMRQNNPAPVAAQLMTGRLRSGRLDTSVEVGVQANGDYNLIGTMVDLFYGGTDGTWAMPDVYERVPRALVDDLRYAPFVTQVDLPLE